MSHWAEAVTHPLGLVGLALFLIFSLLTARKRKELSTWKIAFLLTVAVLVLVSGLGLAAIESKKPPSKAVSPQPSVQIRQDTKGNLSPAAAATDGGKVNVNVNQAEPAPAEKKNAKEQKAAGQEPTSKKP